MGKIRNYWESGTKKNARTKQENSINIRAQAKTDFAFESMCVRVCVGGSVGMCRGSEG